MCLQLGIQEMQGRWQVESFAGTILQDGQRAGGNDKDQHKKADMGQDREPIPS